MLHPVPSPVVGSNSIVYMLVVAMAIFMHGLRIVFPRQALLSMT